MPDSVDTFVTRVLIACAMSLQVAAVTAVAASTAAADDMARPPLGFFDYLGSMVEHDGELIDPLLLQATMTEEEETPDGHGSPNDVEEVQ